MGSGLRFGLILVVGASLAACGDRSDRDAPGNDPFATTSDRTEDQFGKEFGKAYRADPNSEPMNVNDGDVVPVSSTTEPIVAD